MAAGPLAAVTYDSDSLLILNLTNMNILTIEYQGKIIDAYKYNPTGYPSDLHYKVLNCGGLSLPPFIHYTEAKEVKIVVENDKPVIKYA